MADKTEDKKTKQVKPVTFKDKSYRNRKLYIDGIYIGDVKNSAITVSNEEHIELCRSVIYTLEEVE